MQRGTVTERRSPQAMVRFCTCSAAPPKSKSRMDARAPLGTLANGALWQTFGVRLVDAAALG